MSVFLFTLCIAPLVRIMRLALEGGLALGLGAGAAVLLLSLAVNLALWPIYALAEGWQEDERALQRRMAAKLAEIRAVYQGRERYMFVRALYRLHGYHPLLSLRSALGLLIQIPFFLAAYNLLSQAPELAGQNFWIIGDLARPDALFSLGSLQINLLPLLMTGVNLLSAAVYSSRLSRRDKVQLYALSALFLILLYQAAAGLLLYWTCNNIFSLFKNFYYLKYVYTDSRPRRAEEPGPGLLERLRGWLAAWPDAPLAVMELALVLLSVTLMIVDGRFFRLSTGVYDQFIFMLPALLAALLAVLLRSRKLRQEEDLAAVRHIHGLISILFFLYTLGNLSGRRVAPILPLLHSVIYIAALAFLLFWLLSLPRISKPGLWLARGSRKLISEHEGRRLFQAAILPAASLIFLYHPALLYASDPDFFTDPPAELLGYLVFFAMTAIGLSSLALRRCPPAGRPLLGAGMAWLSMIMLFHSFVLIVDYGVLEGHVLPLAHKLQNWSNIPADLTLGLLLALGLGRLLRRGKATALAASLRGLAALVILLALGQILQAEPQNPKPAASPGKPPAYAERLFTFSGSGNNIVVIMLDQFTGEHLGLLMEQEPGLMAAFDGFTWYRDNLSPGNRTHVSLPGMLGGPAYNPPEVNARTDRPLEEIRNEAYAVLPNILLPQGYDVIVTHLDALQPEIFGKFCPRASEILITGNTESAFLPWWLDKAGEPAPAPRSDSWFMAMCGLFKSAPLSLRQGIYSQGNWMNSIPAHHYRTKAGYAQLEALTDFFRIRPESAPAFKYIHSDLTHAPWEIDADCRPTGSFSGMTVTPDGVILEHLWAEKCALRLVSRWLDQLKTEGIYDRAQIILVADHGYRDAPGLLRLEDLDGLGGAYNMRGSALLLVKNFAERHPLEVSDLLMSSSDILPLICRAQKGLCGDWEYDDPLLQDETRPRRRTYSNGPANHLRHDRLLSFDDYLVEGSIYKRESWSKMPPAGR
ncbi:MAG: YidC/Oxa1 family membrane protein insertase [Desulfovibrionaceae bacterium]|nr:YidC/Oxa1 family membrane protein insertase [Desulfovibrionaceae bacterium]